ncbi:hypothetical protein LTSEWAN_6479, partial [Salmonella enterica subsp. enterica serovar Wandsworth str. A4-580]
MRFSSGVSLRISGAMLSVTWRVLTKPGRAL